LISGGIDGLVQNGTAEVGSAESVFYSAAAWFDSAGSRFIGHLDDRPQITIAGARAGKTSTVLEPNLYVYPGSMLVLDPKGELARSASLLPSPPIYALTCFTSVATLGTLKHSHLVRDCS
jgi:type IV secretion system protein VirD4